LGYPRVPILGGQSRAGTLRRDCCVHARRVDGSVWIHRRPGWRTSAISQLDEKGHTMCGIAGWVSYDGDLRTQRDVIATMTKTMARRGPDADGVFINRHVGLGHRRLAVIDLAGGVQPMQADEEGRTTVSLIYTGEVYNFEELRDELSHLGHRFKTRSDTEVVL